jgi:hypothetical protein
MADRSRERKLVRVDRKCESDERHIMKTAIPLIRVRILGVLILIATLHDLSQTATASQSTGDSDGEIGAEVRNRSDASKMTCQNTFTIVNSTYWCHTHCWDAQGRYAGGDLTVMQTGNPHEAMTECQDGQDQKSAD